MLQTDSHDLGYAGKYLRDYEPVDNAHVFVNRVLRASRQLQISSAVIVQQKKFPDVSFYQREIDWDEMRKHTDAIIIRAGQNTWVDSQFERNWNEAKRVGMRRGVYWFWDDRVSPGKQAEILITLIADDLPEMEVFIDWERKYGGPYGGLSNVVAWMQAVERALITVTVGTYTGYYFWRENTNPITNILQYSYVEARPLWLPWYADASIVRIPAPWTNAEPGLTHWQFGTPVVQWGQKTAELDMNYFDGTLEEFDQRYDVSTVTPPPIEPPTGGPMRGTVTRLVTRVLNVRTASGSIIAALKYDFTLNKGDVVYGEVKPDDRIYFNKIYRANGTVQSLNELCSAITKEGTSIYMDLANVPEPGTEPPPPPEPSGDVTLKSWQITVNIDGADHTFNG